MDDQLGAGETPVPFAFRFDFRAVVFTVGLSVLTGIACGLAPVWRNSGLDLIEALKGGSGRTSSARGGRLRQLLVAGQFAASLLLALGALLMVRSYLNQQRLEPGYSSDGLFVTDILLSSEAYAEGAVRVDFAERALDGLRRIPGVSSAGLADFLPISPRETRLFRSSPKAARANRERRDFSPCMPFPQTTCRLCSFP